MTDTPRPNARLALYADVIRDARWKDGTPVVDSRRGVAIVAIVARAVAEMSSAELAARVGSEIARLRAALDEAETHYKTLGLAPLEAEDHVHTAAMKDRIKAIQRHLGGVESRSTGRDVQ
jgi:hypothetical protein